MYVVVWEYEVKPEAIDRFLSGYGPEGQWATLFARGEGFMGVELYRSTSAPALKSASAPAPTMRLRRVRRFMRVKRRLVDDIRDIGPIDGIDGRSSVRAGTIDAPTPSSSAMRCKAAITAPMSAGRSSGFFASARATN